MNLKRTLWAWLLLAAPALAQDIVPGRYIVELTTEPAASRRGISVERRARVQSEQRTVGDVIRGRRGRVVAAVDRVANALIVEVAPGDEAALLGLPNVKRIEPDRQYQLRLDRAIPLTGANIVWEKLGGRSEAGKNVRIAILDTGIDSAHPSFDMPGMVAPSGFPQISSESNRSLTNNKIIVVRSYEGGNGTAIDRYGHGTAVAAVAAGAPFEWSRSVGQTVNDTTWTRGTASGIAPGAFIGAYKVSTGDSGSINSSTVLRALDDAVNDGMDVINMSFGSNALRPLNEDVLAGAMRRLDDIGIIVVNSAGNSGPDPMTLDDTASLASVIGAGASNNDRVLTLPLVRIGGATFEAYSSDNAGAFAPITAKVVDIRRFDPTGLGCQEYPENALAGTIAFIQRGECTFEDKLNHAQRAGALAALIATHTQSPTPNPMTSASATLPALMVSYADGLTITDRVQADENLEATLQFYYRLTDSNGTASFSSRGPSLDYAIKPDLMTVGASVLTASQTNNAAGRIFSSTGAVTVSGTSFSAPLIAGAAAVLKGARPGLSTAEYRSLLINSATPAPLADGALGRVQNTGAGLLNLSNALNAMTVAAPTSLSFGAGGSTLDQARQLTLKNLSQDTATLTVSVETADFVGPVVSSEAFSLGPGASAAIEVSFRSSALALGAYQGFLIVRSTATDVPARIPYWYGAGPGPLERISIVSVPETARPGQTATFYFRLQDAAGIALVSPAPAITATQGSGTLLSLTEPGDRFPGTWVATVQMGTELGTQTFRITAGEKSATVTIRAQ